MQICFDDLYLKSVLEQKMYIYFAYATQCYLLIPIGIVLLYQIIEIILPFDSLKNKILYNIHIWYSLLNVEAYCLFVGYEDGGAVLSCELSIMTSVLYIPYSL